MYAPRVIELIQEKYGTHCVKFHIRGMVRFITVYFYSGYFVRSLSMYLRTKKTTPAYRPGLDRKSAYKSVWLRHWLGFQESHPKRFGPIYGDLTPEKRFEVAKLLSCGDYRNGFRKHVCPECSTVLMVPFTMLGKGKATIHRKQLPVI